MGKSTAMEKRKSISGPARMIYNEAEKFGGHIRAAARLLWQGYSRSDTFSRPANTFGSLVDSLTADGKDNIALRASWFLVNQWLYIRLWSSHPEDLTFEDAEKTFLATDRLADVALSKFFSYRAKRQALAMLGTLRLNEDFRDLLPYALDPHGPGSRASVMRDPSTASTRHRKRQKGVFFTPEDVAEYMVKTALRKVSATGVSNPTVFDPACGTGVFLRVAFRNLTRDLGLRAENALALLHGTDICLQSIETCTFVLMHTLSEIQGSVPKCPVHVWRQVRKNLVVMDSCRLVREDGADGILSGRGMKTDGHIQAASVDSELEVQYAHPLNSLLAGGCARAGVVRLGNLFPAMNRGADLIVGNPPYNRLGHRDDRAMLKKQFACLSNRTWSHRAETYLLFVEMMWKLTNPNRGAAILVVPMSLSYNTTNQFRLCRRAMQCQSGTWQIAFFDREPHALFGEDVKTRNAIVLFHRHNDCGRQQTARMQVTGLRRWTSRSRESLFSSLRFVDVGGICIEAYVPKLGSEEELRNYTQIKSRQQHMSDSITFSSQQLGEVGSDPTAGVVYVSGTAYNFLNVFRTLGADELEMRASLSTSAVHALSFASEKEAWVGYAILSGRMTYWLWQVTGDGFHVTRQFLRDLPFDTQKFSEDAKDELAVLGKKMWVACLQRRTINVNRGRTTFAFRPVLGSPNLTRVDEIIVDELALASGFPEVLRAYVQNLVVMEDAKRLHLLR
ncbi:MAG: N-6 DNA methylase [Planctomycetota bacterium]